MIFNYCVENCHEMFVPGEIQVNVFFWGGTKVSKCKVSNLLDNESEVCILIERKVHKYMHTEIPSVTAMTPQICQIFQ